MWYKRLFRPAKKIGEGEEATQTPSAEVVVTLAESLQTFIAQVDVDALVEDPIIRRYLLTLYWGDITQLFDAILYNKKETPSLTAVNIYSYFKPAGTSASVCLARLSESLNQTGSLPYLVSMDIKHLIAELKKASVIDHQTQLKGIKS